MARIVLSPIGTLGDLHPFLAIGRELKAMGHEPVIAVMDAYREKVESHGLTFHSTRPHFTTNDKEMLKYLLHPTRGTIRLFRDLIIPGMEEAYSDLLPAIESCDLYVGHPLSFGGIAAARKTDTPWFSTVLAPISMLSIYDRSVFPAPVPVHWIRPLGPGAWQLLLAAAKLSTFRIEGKIRRFFKDKGLEPPRHPIFEDQHSTHGVLALFSSVVGAPQPDWPTSTHQGGFPFLDRDQELPPDIQEFLAAGPPPLVFTLGSAAVFLASDFFEVAARALAGTSHRAIFLIGEEGTPPARVDPAQIHVAGYCPFDKLLPRASAVIHSGGIGTIAEVLRAGKPSIVVPFANDQFDNADRLRARGLGTSIPRGKWKPKRILSEIEALLSNATMAENCRKAARQVRGENGARHAAESLASYIKKENPPGPR